MSLSCIQGLALQTQTWPGTSSARELHFGDPWTLLQSGGLDLGLDSTVCSSSQMDTDAVKSMINTKAGLAAGATSPVCLK